MKHIIIAICATLLAFILLCVSAFKIISITNESQKAQELYQSLYQEAVEINEFSSYLGIDHAALRERNAHYIGWLDLPNTGISYPMVRHTDNDYYLRRSFDGEPLQVGVIFMDYRSNPNLSQTNTVIYGHHAKDGSMFAALKYYMDEDFCREHPDIHVYTPDGIRVYTIFSVYQTTTGSDCFTFDFSSDQQRAEWVNSMTAHSAFDFGMEVSATDKILTLATCTNTAKEGRYVVQAVLKENIENG